MPGRSLRRRPITAPRSKFWRIRHAERPRSEALSRATQQALAESAQGTAQAEAFTRATQQSLAEQARGTAQAEAISRATQEAIAVQQALLAQEQSQVSRSRELAAAAINSLDQDPQLSLLLSIQAYHTSGTGEAEAALHQAAQASHLQKILSSDQAGMGAMISLAYSPDGALLAAVHSKTGLQVFDTATGDLVYTYLLDEKLRELEELGSNLAGFRCGMQMEAEFFPDGQLCLEGSKWFVLLDGRSGQELFRGTSEGLIVQVIDRLSGVEIFHFDHTSEGNMPIYVESTPTGPHILVYNQNESNAIGELTAYHLLTGQQVFTRRWERSGEWFYQLNRIEYSPDGSRLALMQGNAFEVWDLATGQLMNRLTQIPTDYILKVTFSPDGARLAVRDAANSLKAWQVDSGEAILYTVATDFFFSPDSQNLLVTDANKKVIVWSLQTRRVLYDFLCNPAQNVSALRPDGKQFAAGGGTGDIYLCEVSPGYELRQWVSDHLVLNYAYAPGPALLGIASADNRIRLYDGESGALYSTLSLPPNSTLRQFDISADGARIVTMEENLTDYNDPMFFLHIWETATGKEITRWVDEDSMTFRFHISPDGNWLLGNGDEVFSTVFSTDDFRWLSTLLWLDWSPFSALGYQPRCIAPGAGESRWAGGRVGKRNGQPGDGDDRLPDQRTGCPGPSPE